MSSRRSFYILSILLALSISAEAGDRSRWVKRDCSNLMVNFSFINKHEAPIDYFDDLSYLTEYKRASAFGDSDTRYSEKFRTRLFYSTSAMLDPKTGEIPMIDPNTKGVFILLTGSGTAYTSGRTQVDLIKRLRDLGYSAISFDYPFHGDGPQGNRFYDSDYFMNWLNDIVKDVRAMAGKQPVYMSGHSFGPTVMSEYVYRFPFALDGVVQLSPAGFTPELEAWYMAHTQHMKFGGVPTPENTMGGEWAGLVERGFRWNRENGAKDPTRINPNLKMRILSGNMEEYVPAPVGGPNGLPIGPNTYDISVPLRKLFSNATITIEPNVGHMIFDKVDANGTPLIVRELLLLAGEDPLRISQIVKEVGNNRPNAYSALLGYEYGTDRIFRVWADEKIGKRHIAKVVHDQNDIVARKMLDQYAAARLQREDQLRARIASADEWAPDFYELYRAQIDKIKANPKEPANPLFMPFQEYLQFLSNVEKRKAGTYKAE